MKLLNILIISSLCGIHCYGQSDSTVKPAADTVNNKSTFTIGAVYSNNANYYGQRAEENIPYVAAAATYRTKSGIYFSGTAYRLLKDTAGFVSAGSLGAGIEFKLSKKFSADLSYSHTFYPALSPFLQASNPDNASASIIYDNWLSSKVTADYAFGKTQDFFVTAGTGKQVKLGSISPKDIITITPAFDVTAGTQRFYQTYLTEKRLRDSLLGIVLTPIFGPPSQDGGSTTIVTTQFNLLSYNFKLPVAYNRANYLFEIEYQLSVLSKKAQSGSGKANSFFSASFYYQF